MLAPRGSRKPPGRRAGQAQRTAGVAPSVSKSWILRAFRPIRQPAPARSAKLVTSKVSADCRPAFASV